MSVEIRNLEQMLARVEELLREKESVSLRRLLPVFGRRSFAPLLLLAGLITAAPVIGDVPGVPTVMGVFVVLLCTQMLLHRQHLWLAAWLLDRTVGTAQVRRVVAWLHRPARLIDRLLRPRLSFMLHGAGTYAIAVTCLLIGVALPTMEVIPLAANGAGVALTAFGLALVADDGLLALIAFGLTAATAGLTLYGLL